MAPSPSKSSHSRAQARPAHPSLDIPYVWSPAAVRVVLIALGVLSVASALLYALPMRDMIGATGFPLDESWIPLTFARTLREAFSYAAFPGDPATSGTTAPLYVFVLALAGTVLSDPVTLAWTIGTLSFAALVMLTFLAGVRLFPREQWLALVAALLVLFVPRLQSAALSGMPTMLFAALAMGALWAHAARRWTALGVLLGLAVWVRPDALVLALAVAAHAVWVRLVPASNTDSGSAAGASPQATIRTGLIAWIVLTAGYILFNVTLGGSVFPNTVAARIAYFKDLAGQPFLQSVYFYFAGPVGAPLIVFVAIALISAVIDLVRRRAVPMLFPILVLAGTVAAYGFVLPRMYDDGRYMAPVLPFVLILGVWGVRHAFVLLLRAVPVPLLRHVGNATAVLVLLAAALTGLLDWSGKRREHFEAVLYVHDRQVAAAEWIAASTPGTAVIATHVPGAVSYIGGRRTIDITGALTPALLPSIGNLFDIERYLRGVGATHVAALRERFEVVNVNALFTSDLRVPEVMEVFPYIPGRTHIMSQRASALNAQAAQLMQNRADQQALPVLEQSFKEDAASSRTATLLGVCLLNLADTANAVIFLNEALRLHGDYAPAMPPLADIYVNRREYTNAYTLMEHAVRLNPTSQIARDAYERLVNAHVQDSLRRLGFRITTASGN